jgi:hypothetical protein
MRNLIIIISLTLSLAIYSADKKNPRIAKIPKSALSQNSLIGSWSFDEEKRESVNDSSVAKNHGVIKGKALWSTESAPAKKKLKNSIILDGKTYIDAIKPEDLNTIQTQMTISVWLKPKEEPKRYGCVLSRQIQSSTGEHYGLYLKKNKLGFMFNMHKKGGGAIWVKKPFKVGEWIHVAAVVDGQSINIYINGTKEVSKQWQGEFSPDFTKMVIGGNAGGKESKVAEFFKGQLNTLKIYNYGISVEQLSLLAKRVD